MLHPHQTRAVHRGGLGVLQGKFSPLAIVALFLEQPHLRPTLPLITDILKLLRESISSRFCNAALANCESLRAAAAPSSSPSPSSLPPPAPAPARVCAERVRAFVERLATLADPAPSFDS